MGIKPDYMKDDVDRMMDARSWQQGVDDFDAGLPSIKRGDRYEAGRKFAIDERKRENRDLFRR